MEPTTAQLLDRLHHDEALADRVAPQLARIVADLDRRDAFWEDVSADQKAEWINGGGIFHSPVLARHSNSNRELSMSLGLFLKEHPIGNFFFEKSMVRFDSNDYEPDIIFYLNEKLARVKPDTLIHPIPDFIVEILSESTERNDRGIKLLDYASHGVQEYWIVDPEHRAVEQYLPTQRGVYAQAQKVAGQGVLESKVVAGWSIEVATLWQPA